MLAAAMGRALLTDLYELNMAASYLKRGMTAPATFSLFVRNLPPRWGFLVACGLDPCLAYLESFRFQDQQIEYLRAEIGYPEETLDAFGALRFTGEIRAMPEGRLVFPDEPLLEVTAPLPEAQVVETYLLNQITYQTAVASKAARCRLAAPEARMVDFSLRRVHGGDGPFLCGVVPHRSRGLPGVRRRLPRSSRPPGRHVRHRAGHREGHRGRPGDGDPGWPAGRHPFGQWRPGRPGQGSSPGPGRRRPHRRRDPGVGRPRRGRPGRAGWGRGPDRRLRSGNQDRGGGGRPRPGHGVQAGGLRRGARGQAVHGQGHTARAEAGVEASGHGRGPDRAGRRRRPSGRGTAPGARAPGRPAHGRHLAGRV